VSLPTPHRCHRRSRDLWSGGSMLGRDRHRHPGRTPRRAARGWV